jgi:hypothetical protein
MTSRSQSVKILTSAGRTGRPPKDTQAITLRLSTDQIRRLDDYRREQEDLPNRPEAIRRLLDKALAKK